MAIRIMLDPPSGFSEIQRSFRTERNADTQFRWSCTGVTANCFAAAKLAGRIRGVLESFQELHCSVEDVHIGANQHMIVPNGVIRVWTDESRQLAEGTMAEISQLLEELQRAPLREFDFFVQFDLRAQPISTAPAPWSRSMFGQPNRDGAGW